MNNTLTIGQAYECYYKGLEVKCDGDNHSISIQPNQEIRDTLNKIYKVFSDLVNVFIKAAEVVIEVLKDFWIKIKKYINNSKQFKKFKKKFSKIFSKRNNFIKVKKGKKYIYFLHKIKA